MVVGAAVVVGAVVDVVGWVVAGRVVAGRVVVGFLVVVVARRSVVVVAAPPPEMPRKAPVPGLPPGAVVVERLGPVVDGVREESGRPLAEIRLAGVARHGRDRPVVVLLVSVALAAPGTRARQ